MFPNILDYWGPNGMLFFRNTQVYYRIKNDAHLRATVAIEAPGGSGDGGIYSDRVEVQNITPRFPMPDLTGNVRYTKNRGYVQAGGIVRRINYDDTLADQFNLSGDVTGWGISLSSNVTATKDDTLRLQVRLRSRHRELHERRPGRYRHPEQPGKRRDADSRHGASGHGARESSWTTTGTTR